MGVELFFVRVLQIHNYARLMSLLKLQQHVAKKEMQMPVRSPRKGFRMKAVKSYRLECVEHGINVTSHMNLPTR